MADDLIDLSEDVEDIKFAEGGEVDEVDDGDEEGDDAGEKNSINDGNGENNDDDEEEVINDAPDVVEKILMLQALMIEEVEGEQKNGNSALTYKEARLILQQNGWDVQRAANIILDSNSAKAKKTNNSKSSGSSSKKANGNSRGKNKMKSTNGTSKATTKTTTTSTTTPTATKRRKVGKGKGKASNSDGGKSAAGQSLLAFFSPVKPSSIDAKGAAVTKQSKQAASTTTSYESRSPADDDDDDDNDDAESDENAVNILEDSEQASKGGNTVTADNRKARAEVDGGSSHELNFADEAGNTEVNMVESDVELDVNENLLINEMRMKEENMTEKKQGVNADVFNNRIRTSKQTLSELEQREQKYKNKEVAGPKLQQQRGDGHSSSSSSSAAVAAAAGGGSSSSNNNNSIHDESSSQHSRTGNSNHRVEVRSKVEVEVKAYDRPSAQAETIMLPANKFDPLQNAPFHNGQPVPYLLVARAFSQITTTKKRLAIADGLTNTFRSVMELGTAEEVVCLAHLIMGSIAARHEGVDLGVGHSTVKEAVLEATGVKAGKLAELYRATGDM